MLSKERFVLPPILRRRIPLLEHSPNFRNLWASTIFTASEEVLHFTVMPLYVLNLTGSGAVLAGGLLALYGAPSVFALLLLVRLAAIFWISRIGYAQNVHPAAAHTAAGPRWLADLRSGFRYAAEHPEVRALLITTAGSNMGMG